MNIIIVFESIVWYNFTDMLIYTHIKTKCIIFMFSVTIILMHVKLMKHADTIIDDLLSNPRRVRST